MLIKNNLLSTSPLLFFDKKLKKILGLGKGSSDCALISCEILQLLYKVKNHVKMTHLYA